MNIRESFMSLEKGLKMASEKSFENKIKKYLDKQGAWYVKFFANAYTKKGVPDILACVDGMFYGIEVKAEGGKPSEIQKYNIQKINESGGVAIILKPTQFHLLKEMIETKNINLVEEINSEWGL